MYGRTTALSISASLLASVSPALAETTVGFSYPEWDLVSLGYVGAAGLTGLIAFYFLTRAFFNKALIPTLPKPNFRDIVPYRWIEPDGRTVQFEDGSRMAVIEVGGINYASDRTNEVTSGWRSRLSWLKQVSEREVEVMVVGDRGAIHVTTGGVVGNEWLTAINERWADTFDDALHNRNWIVLIERKGKSGSGGLADVLRSTMEILDGHNPQIIQHPANAGPDNPISPLWNFLEWMVNGDGVSGIAGEGEGLNEGLVTSSKGFESGTGIVVSTNGDEVRYSQAVVVSKLGGETDFALMNRLMRLPFELTVYQYIKTMPKALALKEVREKSGNAVLHFNKTEFEDTRDELMEDRDGLARWEMVVFVHGKTKRGVVQSALEVRKVLARLQYTALTETVFHEIEWMRRLGCKVKKGREFVLRLSNVADLTPFEATPRGLNSCWWGPSSLRVMRTITGAPYELGIHQHERDEALANTLIFGAPGRGKTVLASWLISGAISKFPGMRVFAFDNLDGLSVPTRAFGGTLINPGRGDDAKSAEMAPLQMDDTDENRRFLVRWLMEITRVTTEDANARKALETGVGLAMLIPRHERTLTNFYDTCLEKNNAAATGLQAWLAGGVYEGWFDGERDGIDLDASPWLTFDMQNMLEAPEVASAFVSYLMHRIRTEVWSSPTPHIIFMDEAPTLFAASELVRELGEMLARNIRKKMGAIWFAFQDADGMRESRGALLQTAANFFFFRDPSINAEQYAEWFNLTEGDVRFILDEDDASRLVRRAVLFVRKRETGVESVPIDLNLSALGKYLNLFRSGVDAAEHMEICTREHGVKWVGPYLEKFS